MRATRVATGGKVQLLSPNLDNHDSPALKPASVSARMAAACSRWSITGIMVTVQARAAQVCRSFYTSGKIAASFTADGVDGVPAVHDFSVRVSGKLNAYSKPTENGDLWSPSINRGDEEF
jgi:hypothetical protein